MGAQLLNNKNLYIFIFIRYRCERVTQMTGKVSMSMSMSMSMRMSKKEDRTVVLFVTGKGKRLEIEGLD